MTAPTTTPTLATVLAPRERLRLDAAAHGTFRPLHASSVRDAIRAVRECPIHAVLVSPRALPREALPDVDALVRGFPGVPTVAVVSQHDAHASERLLLLGASGVRRFIDLTQRAGWQRLRELVSQPASPTAARILAVLLPALGRPTPAARFLFEAMVRHAPAITSVRALTRHLGLPPSTFMSRFLRAGLPSPKRYLAGIRLAHAAALLEAPGLSIADVAYRLEYSSPQSFGRHVRTLTGLTAGAFRRTVSFDACMRGLLDDLVIPYRALFHAFQPVKRIAVEHLGPEG